MLSARSVCSPCTDSLINRACCICTREADSLRYDQSWWFKRIGTVAPHTSYTLNTSSIRASNQPRYLSTRMRVTVFLRVQPHLYGFDTLHLLHSCVTWSYTYVGLEYRNQLNAFCILLWERRGEGSWLRLAWESVRERDSLTKTEISHWRFLQATGHRNALVKGRNPFLVFPLWQKFQYLCSPGVPHARRLEPAGYISNIVTNCCYYWAISYLGNLRVYPYVISRIGDTDKNRESFRSGVQEPFVNENVAYVRSYTRPLL